MAEPTKITLRQNGSNQGTLSGTAGQFATLIRESPQNLISQALMQDTGDPERPGKVCDWLLPGWKFDIDYRCDETGRPIEIVTRMLEPRKRR